MDLLVTYDVSTLTTEGKGRLRKVAKICQGYGQRVQLSVFEVSVNDAQHETMRARLVKVMEPSEDSLRIYILRGRREDVVETYGINDYVNFHDPLII